MPLVDEIKKVGGEGANFAVTTFIQGKGTRRWGVAWSWTGWRPGWGFGVCGVKAKGIGGKVKPFKGVCEILVPVGKEGEGEGDKVKRSVIGIIEDVAKSAGKKELRWGITGGKSKETLINGWVNGDLWSRAARRRRARAAAAVDSAQHDHEQPQEEEAQGRDVDENLLKGMWFRITIAPAAVPAPATTTTQNEEGEDEDEDEEMTPAPEQQLYDYTPPHAHAHTHVSSVQQVQQRGPGAATATLLTLRLIRCNPSDTMLFESFCGMLRRRILLEPVSGA